MRSAVPLICVRDEFFLVADDDAFDDADDPVEVFRSDVVRAADDVGRDIVELLGLEDLDVTLGHTLLLEEAVEFAQELAPECAFLGVFLLLVVELHYIRQFHLVDLHVVAVFVLRAGIEAVLWYALRLCDFTLDLEPRDFLRTQEEVLFRGRVGARAREAGLDGIHDGFAGDVLRLHTDVGAEEPPADWPDEFLLHALNPFKIERSVLIVVDFALIHVFSPWLIGTGYLSREILLAEEVRISPARTINFFCISEDEINGIWYNVRKEFVMHRELPEIVRRLLRTPDSQETLAFVSRSNVSRRNWDIFCRAMGGGGREKVKQREVADVYKISAPRVSKIVKDVLKRLSLAEIAPQEPDIVRAYRTWRFSTLKGFRVVNAEAVSSVRARLMTRYHQISGSNIGNVEACSVDFVAEGVSLRIVGRSFLPYGYFDRRDNYVYTGYCTNYTILWAEKDEVPSELRTNNIFKKFSLWKASDLLLDYNETYWVADRVEVFQGANRLVVYLKRAKLCPDRCSERPPVRRIDKYLSNLRHNAEHGDIWAADRFGEICYKDVIANRRFERIKKGNGTADDKLCVEEMLKFTKFAAENGMSFSQMRLAAIYADGLGVRRDEAKAKKWLEKSAEANRESCAKTCIDLMSQGKTLQEALDQCRHRIS